MKKHSIPFYLVTVLILTGFSFKTGAQNMENRNLCDQMLQTYLVLDSRGEFLSGWSYFNSSDFYDPAEKIAGGDTITEIESYISAFDKQEDNENFLYTVNYHILGEWAGGQKIQSKDQNQKVVFRLRLIDRQCHIVDPRPMPHVQTAFLKSAMQSINISINSDQFVSRLRTAISRQDRLRSRSRDVLQLFLILDAQGKLFDVTGLIDYHHLTGQLTLPDKKNIVFIKDYKIKYLDEQANQVRYNVIYTMQDTNNQQTVTYTLHWEANQWQIILPSEKRYVL